MPIAAVARCDLRQASASMRSAITRGSGANRTEPRHLGLTIWTRDDDFEVFAELAPGLRVVRT